MSRSSLSRVRANDNGQIEQARITMLKFPLIGFYEDSHVRSSSKANEVMISRAHGSK